MNMHLSTRHNILEYVMENTHSSFYKDFYKKKQYTFTSTFPASEDEWQQLPFLEKHDLTTVPVFDRIFVSQDEVLTFRTTSGTSGSGALVIPRSKPTTYLKTVTEYGVTSFMSFLYPHAHIAEPIREAGVRFVGGNVADFSGSVALAQANNVDALYLSPSLLQAVIPLLKSKQYTERIMYIGLFGERCSVAQHEYFASVFPNAVIGADYSATELQGVYAMPCKELMGNAESLFHVVGDEYYVEIVDEDGEVLTCVGAEGEIVVTTLWQPNPAPMIRYRTGDIARIVAHKCTCGLQYPIIKILGRKTLDYIKIASGEIKIEEVERVIALHTEKLNFDFALEYFTAPEGRLPYILLKVDPKNEDANLEQIAASIAKVLRVSPNTTYADGVTRGLYQPLRCDLLPPRQPNMKVVRLSVH